MQKHLFFICPTDALEGLINRAYKEENYFLSSLANSINFSAAVSETINALIETKCITEISFVLSTNNALFLDALSPQNFNSIKVLHPLYKAVNAQKKIAHKYWKKEHIQIPIMSYYLNSKIEELQSKIDRWIVDSIKINCKIYHQTTEKFSTICPNLFYGKTLNLN